MTEMAVNVYVSVYAVRVEWRLCDATGVLDAT